MDHVMTLAERLTSEADRLDPPYLHEFNEKGQRLGHHPHAYLLRQAATELKQADEAAKDWYAAASPYATPEALREALTLARQKIGQGLMAAERAYLRLLKLGDYEDRHSLAGQTELAALRDFIAAVVDKDAQMVQDEFEACAKLRECYWHWTIANGR